MIQTGGCSSHSCQSAQRHLVPHPRRAADPGRHFQHRVPSDLHTGPACTVGCWCSLLGTGNFSGSSRGTGSHYLRIQRQDWDPVGVSSYHSARVRACDWGARGCTLNTIQTTIYIYPQSFHSCLSCKRQKLWDRNCGKNTQLLTALIGFGTVLWGCSKSAICWL